MAYPGTPITEERLDVGGFEMWGDLVELYSDRCLEEDPAGDLLARGWPAHAMPRVRRFLVPLQTGMREWTRVTYLYVRLVLALFTAMPPDAVFDEALLWRGVALAKLTPQDAFRLRRYVGICGLLEHPRWLAVARFLRWPRSRAACVCRRKRLSLYDHTLLFPCSK